MSTIRTGAAAAALALAGAAVAQDVEIVPPPAGNVVVLDSTRAQARFMVNEDGTVTITGLPSSVQQD